MHINLEVSPPSSSTRKLLMGRDAAKAERKKAKSTSHEYAAKMHELSIERFRCLKRVRLSERFDTMKSLI
jgi:hypothetical protein